MSNKENNKNDEKRLPREVKVTKTKKVNVSNCRTDKNHKDKKEAY